MSREDQNASDMLPIKLERPSENGGEDFNAQRFAGTALMSAVAPSGIWVVIKFDPDLAEGKWSEEFRTATIVQEREGIDAIRKVYARDLQEKAGRAVVVRDEEEPPPDMKMRDAKGEDGRYVALDFYTGHRVEAAVRGQWIAEVDLASR